MFIEVIHQSKRHSLQNYCTTSSQADLTDFSFDAEPLLDIQKESGQQPIVNKLSISLRNPYYVKPWAKLSTTNNVNTDTTCSPSHSSKRRFKALPLRRVQYSGQLSSNSSSSLSSSALVPSVKPHFCNICCDPGHFAARRPLPASPHFAHSATICSANRQKRTTSY